MSGRLISHMLLVLHTSYCDLVTVRQSACVSVCVRVNGPLFLLLNEPWFLVRTVHEL